ncbi:hypothetical protein BX600DRAFT_435460 [Xylariales sp. PMI_506]|nr:hypothetical protein BX600DRAFT_435460 [Xylariales sp. PMI_506]
MTSLYDLSIPVLTKVLTTLTAVLKKGEAFAQEKGIQPSEVLEWRVVEDMLNLRAQVIITLGTSRKAVERLTGVAPPDVIQGREQTLPELYALIEDTQAVLKAVSKAEVDARDGQVVPCKYGPQDFEAPAAEYVQGYAIPTVYFHLVTAYDIFRGKGVPLGKKDYIGAFMQDFKQL